MSLDPIDLTRLEALHAEATRFYASGRIELTHDDETARRWAVVVFEAFPALLAELKELREKVQMTVDYNTALRAERDRLRAERDAANDTIANLRRELADALEAGEWRRIDEKTPREAWVWVGRWWDDKNFIQSKGMFAIDRSWHDWTHWMPLTAPPEVKP